MDKNTFDNLHNIPIPPIANGTYLPPNIEMQIMKEEERQKQIDELKQISVSLNKQIKLMEEQMDNYEKENANSKKQSRISMMLSIIAIASTFIASIIPKLLELLGL